MENSFTDINKLISYLKIDQKNQKKILKKNKFPLLLPQNLARKIKKNDLNDPIFKQFVPTIEENKFDNNYLQDPLLEKKFSKNKLIKKYNKRALLITSFFCAMHCRFCFRKHLKKQNDINFDKELKMILDDKSLEEIILSGGDPLSLSNFSIKNLLEKLDSIDHLKRIRIHTRFVIGFPKRIDLDFLKILKKIKKQIIFVFHINHPNELDEEVLSSIQKLKKNGFILLNQSVLLKGINDNFDILKELNEKLLEVNVIPYYLHQLDKVKGSKHFEVSQKKGKKLLKSLKENLAGYLCPKYAQEIPYEKNKTLL